MLRKELDIQKVRKHIAHNQQIMKENLMSLYQMDLIEQVKSMDTYPAQFRLPISAEGFSYKELIYASLRESDYYYYTDCASIAKELVKQLQKNGWTIHDNDIFYEDGEMYFYLEE